MLCLLQEVVVIVLEAETITRVGGSLTVLEDEWC